MRSNSLSGAHSPWKTGRGASGWSQRLRAPGTPQTAHTNAAPHTSATPEQAAGLCFAETSVSACQPSTLGRSALPLLSANRRLLACRALLADTPFSAQLLCWRAHPTHAYYAAARPPGLSCACSHRGTKYLAAPTWARSRLGLTSSPFAPAARARMRKSRVLSNKFTVHCTAARLWRTCPCHQGQGQF